MSQPGWLDWPTSSKTRILKPSARQRGFERFGWRPHWVIPIQLEYFVKIFFQPALLSSHHRSVLPSFPPHWDVLSGDVYQPRSWTPKAPAEFLTSPLWAGKSKGDRRLKAGKCFYSLQLIAPKYVGQRCQSFHFSQKDKQQQLSNFTRWKSLNISLFLVIR